jgi:transglutaminase-like putative cysteine protease
MKMTHRKIRQRTFLVVLSILVASSALHAQTRDYWLKTERLGVGFAYEHTTVTKLPDGNSRYDYVQHIKTDVAGLNPQDITLNGSYVVTSALKPLSIDLRTKFQVREQSIKGTCQKDILTLTITDKEGQTEKRDIPVKDTYFDVVASDLIFRNAGKKNFPLKTFNSLGITVDQGKVAITRADREEVEATLTNSSTTRFRIDRNGQVKEIIYVQLNGRAYLTDPKDAQNITYLNTADSLSLMIRSQRSFPNVFRVSRARIQVQWERIPFEEFRLEDNRQKVAERKESGGKSQVVLEMTKPSPPSETLQVPITDPRWAFYLREDDYIKPRDPAIRKQAAAIVGGETKASVVVQKTAQWVNTNVASDMIAETLTGPEVLQKRRGKCSEYSILFASLARAAGVPTRIVLGELYSNGTWVGHMWNEVWLGEWTAVDAAAGIFVSGPAHLKFIDSATVTGTQGLRWKLTDNLGIEILDFDEETGTAALATGIAGRTYSNKTYSCKISAPDESWTLKEEARSGVLTLLMNSKDAQFAMVLFAVPPGTSAKTVLQGRWNALSKMVKDFKLLEESEADIAGRKAPLAVFSQTERSGTTIVNQNALLVDGTNAYLFAFITNEDRFEQLRPQFRTILATFEIVK